MREHVALFGRRDLGLPTPELFALNGEEFPLFAVNLSDSCERCVIRYVGMWAARHQLAVKRLGLF
ncbi:hypothetical protein WK80_10575 [Burkholderia multivorans]|nr:hypothetical protein WK80_10575 [Burkholderia multivorans]OOA29137.1 hypothetical protein A8F54_29000 [Burkholderia cenocepacia]OOA48375.1 hypothetical protein A8F57_06625 [Burkholderia cenocepacia]OOA74376.1 hypothetical protein A8F63_10440 [Burkholderia cenocepacia]OOB47655.1 hypothetical protein A8F71_26940 [Burkholderia cenocepacia]